MRRVTHSHWAGRLIFCGIVFGLLSMTQGKGKGKMTGDRNLDIFHAVKKRSIDNGKSTTEDPELTSAREKLDKCMKDLGIPMGGICNDNELINAHGKIEWLEKQNRLPSQMQLEATFRSECAVRKCEKGQCPCGLGVNPCIPPANPPERNCDQEYVDYATRHHIVHPIDIDEALYLARIEFFDCAERFIIPGGGRCDPEFQQRASEEFGLLEQQLSLPPQSAFEDKFKFCDNDGTCENYRCTCASSAVPCVPLLGLYPKVKPDCDAEYQAYLSQHNWNLKVKEEENKLITRPPPPTRPPDPDPEPQPRPAPEPAPGPKPGPKPDPYPDPYPDPNPDPNPWQKPDPVKEIPDESKLCLCNKTWRMSPHHGIHYWAGLVLLMKSILIY